LAYANSIYLSVADVIDVVHGIVLDLTAVRSGTTTLRYNILLA